MEAAGREGKEGGLQQGMACQVQSFQLCGSPFPGTPVFGTGNEPPVGVAAL